MMKTIEGDIAQIMHDIRPEGASYVVIIEESMGDTDLTIEAAHGPFDDWEEAMTWADTHDGYVIPLFPLKDDG